MPPVVSVSLLAPALFTVTFAVNLQAPLYDVYAGKSNVGTTAVTISFLSVQAVGTLITVGFWTRQSAPSDADFDAG